MATRRMLADHGHEVRVFAMDYPDNDTIPDAAGYASRVDFGGGSSAKLRASARLFGKGDIVKSASEVLDSFRPDVVHLHNVHSYLSPLIGSLPISEGYGWCGLFTITSFCAHLIHVGVRRARTVRNAFPDA